MDINDEEIIYAIENTEILRLPKQTLATFGTTNIYYYLVTEPSYSDLVDKAKETVVREGKVMAEPPRVITPSYLINLEGFSERAQRYFELMIRKHGPNVPGLFYRYRNESKELTIVSDDLETVVHRLDETIDKKGDPLSAIIKGVDELWDVSVMKFIHDVTTGSLPSNIMDLGRRGLLDIDHSGIPRDARLRIEELFRQVQRGDLDPSELKTELDRWGLFREYEGRFFRLFRKTR